MKSKWYPDMCREAPEPRIHVVETADILGVRFAAEIWILMTVLVKSMISCVDGASIVRERVNDVGLSGLSATVTSTDA